MLLLLSISDRYNYIVSKGITTVNKYTSWLDMISQETCNMKHICVCSCCLGNEAETLKKSQIRVIEHVSYEILSCMLIWIWIRTEVHSCILRFRIWKQCSESGTCLQHVGLQKATKHVNEMFPSTHACRNNVRHSLQCVTFLCMQYLVFSLIQLSPQFRPEIGRNTMERTSDTEL